MSFAKAATSGDKQKHYYGACEKGDKAQENCCANSQLREVGVKVQFNRLSHGNTCTGDSDTDNVVDELTCVYNDALFKQFGGPRTPKDVLYQGEDLKSDHENDWGKVLISANKEYELDMDQKRAIIHIYELIDGKHTEVWVSAPDKDCRDTGPYTLKILGSGSLGIVDSANTVCWQRGSMGYSVQLSDEGTLNLYTKEGENGQKLVWDNQDRYKADRPSQDSVKNGGGGASGGGGGGGDGGERCKYGVDGRACRNRERDSVERAYTIEENSCNDGCNSKASLARASCKATCTGCKEGDAGKRCREWFKNRKLDQETCKNKNGAEKDDCINERRWKRDEKKDEEDMDKAGPGGKCYGLKSTPCNAVKDCKHETACGCLPYDCACGDWDCIMRQGKYKGKSPRGETDTSKSSAVSTAEANAECAKIAKRDPCKANSNCKYTTHKGCIGKTED